MVRSKSESDKLGPDEKAKVVSGARKAKKYLPLSLSDIEQVLDKEGRLHETFALEIEDDMLGTVPLQLSLNINCFGPGPESWKAAVKRDGQRIDGIDHETFFGDKREFEGWHRHAWSLRHQDRKKVPLESFGEGLNTRRDFVIRVLKEFRIGLDRQDHGENGELLID